MELEPERSVGRAVNDEQNKRKNKKKRKEKKEPLTSIDRGTLSKENENISAGTRKVPNHHQQQRNATQRKEEISGISKLNAELEQLMFIAKNKKLKKKTMRRC